MSRVKGVKGSAGDATLGSEPESYCVAGLEPAQETAARICIDHIVTLVAVYWIAFRDV